MKHKLFFFIVLLTGLLIPQPVKAYDFSAVCSTGQTLYYTVKSGNRVTVTYPSYNYTNGLNHYESPYGNVTIPSTVTYNNTT